MYFCTVAFCFVSFRLVVSILLLGYCTSLCIISLAGLLFLTVCMALHCNTV